LSLTTKPEPGSSLVCVLSSSNERSTCAQENEADCLEWEANLIKGDGLYAAKLDILNAVGLEEDQVFPVSSIAPLIALSPTPELAPPAGGWVVRIQQLVWDSRAVAVTTETVRAHAEASALLGMSRVRPSRAAHGPALLSPSEGCCHSQP
jgi:hypothetical protein